MSSGAAPWEWDWIEEQDQNSAVFGTLLDIMKELHNEKQGWIAFA